ncbi:MAG: tyrosine/phenylalanine carboxypeptidase domain-containing protein [Candidatus Nanoarchaeia archaeon]
MRDEDYFLEIQEIENSIKQITRNVSLNYPKPQNSKYQKRKFFKALKEGREYNPQMKYEKRDIPQEVIDELIQLKDSILLEDDRYKFKLLLKKKIQEFILILKMYKHWGEIESTTYSILSRGRPTQKQYRKALYQIKRYERDTVRFKRLSPQKIANALQEEVYKLTGENIRVCFEELANKVMIRAKSGIISINPQETFTSLDLERLKVHEIQTHYMRYFNGSKQPIEILQNGTHNYIKTEEGLAVYMEHKHNVLSKAQLFIYAGRVVANYLSMHYGFYDIFQRLKKLGFKDEDAYKITLRSKRNLKDTSQIGGFTKDYIYFVGFYEVKEHLEKYPEDFEKLFTGKIKLKDLKTLEEYLKKYG